MISLEHFKSVLNFSEPICPFCQDALFLRHGTSISHNYLCFNCTTPHTTVYFTIDKSKKTIELCIVTSSSVYVFEENKQNYLRKNGVINLSPNSILEPTDFNKIDNILLLL